MLHSSSGESDTTQLGRSARRSRRRRSHRRIVLAGLSSFILVLGGGWVFVDRATPLGPTINAHLRTLIDRVDLRVAGVHSVRANGGGAPTDRNPTGSTSQKSPSSSDPATGGGSVPAPSQETTLPQSMMLDVPEIAQRPELPNGCEITALAMLLAGFGQPMDKMVLAKEAPYDPTPETIQNGTIASWGNPNVGFVGVMNKKPGGYGIFHGPLVKFINKLLPGRAVDLTGKPFSDVLQQVANGRPVEVWTTWTFQPTTNWVTWSTPEGPVRVTMDEHAVLLVGYDAHHLFMNNPLNGEKDQKVPMGPFIAAWKQLGQQAVTLSQ